MPVCLQKYFCMLALLDVDKKGACVFLNVYRYTSSLLNSWPPPMEGFRRSRETKRREVMTCDWTIFVHRKRLQVPVVLLFCAVVINNKKKQHQNGVALLWWLVVGNAMVPLADWGRWHGKCAFRSCWNSVHCHVPCSFYLLNEHK